MKTKIKPAYTIAEEVANAITHGIGVVFSFVALVMLVVFATQGGDIWRIVSVSIFGSTLILLYAASTLYHALPQPNVKRIMRIVDHGAIYLLIAGTYTPFLLGDMRGPWGWSLFGVLWGAALSGIIFKIFFVGRFNFIATMLYLAMGWTVVVAFKPAIESIPMAALILMAIGGIAYTSGVVFYLWERLPYNHAIWHLFVLTGSAFHFAAIIGYAT
ncbi:MAG: PAQR family membrane homeostasis protein TrhA [Candidatus Hydrogenedentota bacterium]